MATKTPTKKKVAKKNATKRVVKKVAQKTAHKVSAKKIAKKKVVTKSAKQTKGSLGRKKLAIKRIANPGEHFWVNYGPVVSDLASLANALKEMSDDQYLHHVARGDGNDFARWVEEVFAERALARKLARAQSRMGAYRVIVGYTSLH